MGYIQQSNTKKIYAYLTQTGKEKIITGETKDFLIKYFTLHDEDINYKISSKKSGTTYNVLKSGFMPDITGDYISCLPNISDATFLEKNMLIYEIQIQQTYSIAPDKTNVFETESIIYTITTQNVPDGTVLYWSFGGTAIASDFIENTNSGSVTINSNTATFTLNVKEDNTIESDETIIMYLKDSIGNILATSASVLIKDKPISMATASVDNGCGEATDTYLLTYVYNPAGGSGPPYTWKVKPVDVNNNPITFPIPTNLPPDWGSIRTIPNDPIDSIVLLQTKYNNTDIYYNVYLYDSNNTEYFLLKTAICELPPQPKTFIVSSIPDVSASNIVGSSPPIGSNQPISTSPSATANFNLTIRATDGSELTPDILNNFQVRFEKVGYDDFFLGRKWQYINFFFNGVPFFASSSVSPFLSFNSATSQDLVNYTLPFSINIDRASYQLDRPMNYSTDLPITSGDNFEFKLIIDYVDPNSVTYESETFDIFITTVFW